MFQIIKVSQQGWFIIVVIITITQSTSATLSLKVGFCDPPKSLKKRNTDSKEQKRKARTGCLVATKTAGSILHKARGKMTFSCK